MCVWNSKLLAILSFTSWNVLILLLYKTVALATGQLLHVCACDNIRPSQVNQKNCEFCFSSLEVLYIGDIHLVYVYSQLVPIAFITYL